MKSSYYDLTDKYYGGFCGSGDMVSVVDESVHGDCSSVILESDYERNGEEMQYHVYLLSGSVERAVDRSPNVNRVR